MKASSPPAEAPTPTTVTRLSPRDGVCAPSRFKAALDFPADTRPLAVLPRRFLPTAWNFGGALGPAADFLPADFAFEDGFAAMT